MSKQDRWLDRYLLLFFIMIIAFFSAGALWWSGLISNSTTENHQTTTQDELQFGEYTSLAVSEVEQTSTTSSPAPITSSRMPPVSVEGTAFRDANFELTHGLWEVYVAVDWFQVEAAMQVVCPGYETHHISMTWRGEVGGGRGSQAVTSPLRLGGACSAVFDPRASDSFVMPGEEPEVGSDHQTPDPVWWVWFIHVPEDTVTERQ